MRGLSLGYAPSLHTLSILKCDIWCPAFPSYIPQSFRLLQRNIRAQLGSPCRCGFTAETRAIMPTATLLMLTDIPPTGTRAAAAPLRLRPRATPAIDQGRRNRPRDPRTRWVKGFTCIPLLRARFLSRWERGGGLGEARDSPPSIIREKSVDRVLSFLC